jgi:hypothetical protein
VAPGFAHPLTEMGTRISSGSKAQPARKADNLPAICGSFVLTMWDPQLHRTLQVSMACYRDSFAVLLLLYVIFETGPFVLQQPTYFILSGCNAETSR